MRPDTLIPGGRARRGFTLTEMIIATTMLGLFGASAVTFYLRSLRSVANTAGRNDAQQTASFALDFVDHDLRIAGTNLSSGQPLMVAAGTNFIVFNADLITHDTSASASGTYFDQNVPDSTALAWQVSRAQNLYGSAIAYPDQTYWADSTNGVLSEAETIQFYVRADSTQPNNYILWRQVNANAPTVAAKNIYSATTPVTFTYYYQNQSTLQLVQFPSTSIPVYHTPSNAAMQARLDSIREVRIQFTGDFVDHQNRNQMITRTVNEVVRIPNAYMSRLAQCPGPPKPVSSLGATASTGGQDTVGLTWPKSLDDGTGLQTARMYLIYRRRHVDTTWVQLNAVTAHDTATYVFRDDGSTGLAAGTAYDYAIAVRDCTPALSTLTKVLNITPN
jgi:prepilin-type N-terminal cleavage/methylation domain-containing protein